MKASKPSELELQVLSVLWRKGPSSVRDVMVNLPDGKKRAYTSVLSVLQVMEKKGLVAHTRRRLAHVFSARLTERQAARGTLQTLITRVFGGPAAVMQHLLAEGRLSREEAIEIRRMIGEHLSHADKGKG